MESSALILAVAGAILITLGPLAGYLFFRYRYGVRLSRLEDGERKLRSRRVDFDRSRYQASTARIHHSTSSSEDTLSLLQEEVEQKSLELSIVRQDYELELTTLREELAALRREIASLRGEPVSVVDLKPEPKTFDASDAHPLSDESSSLKTEDAIFDDVGAFDVSEDAEEFEDYGTSEVTDPVEELDTVEGLEPTTEQETLEDVDRVEDSEIIEDTDPVDDFENVDDTESRVYFDTEDEEEIQDEGFFSGNIPSGDEGAIESESETESEPERHPETISDEVVQTEETGSEWDDEVFRYLYPDAPDDTTQEDVLPHEIASGHPSEDESRAFPEFTPVSEWIQPEDARAGDDHFRTLVRLSQDEYQLLCELGYGSVEKISRLSSTEVRRLSEIFQIPVQRIESDWIPNAQLILFEKSR